MEMNIGRRFCALLAASVVFVSAKGEYAENASAFEMTGPTIFTAGKGTTNVYSGVISGTGPAIIEGGGTVAFSNPGNTYSGGTIVSNAVFASMRSEA
jgi:autotransporter-associated beta strand protein